MNFPVLIFLIINNPEIISRDLYDSTTLEDKIKLFGNVTNSNLSFSKMLIKFSRVFCFLNYRVHFKFFKGKNEETNNKNEQKHL